jgi:Predicted nucleic acid-binding protein, contains PIN domain
LQFERLAFDANAAIDSLRPARPFPLPLKAARQLFMPFFVLAELRLDAARSRQSEENAAQVDALVARCEVIAADLDTIPFYIRARNDLAKVRTVPQSIEKREGFGHDIWIAALCLQHQLPLLTNDSLFDQVSALEVIHW